MPDCGAFSLIARHGRHEDVLALAFLVLDVSLLFRDPKQSPHCRITRCLRHDVEYFRCGCRSFPVENIHDLTLAPAQVKMSECHDAKKLAAWIWCVNN